MLNEIEKQTWIKIECSRLLDVAEPKAREAIGRVPSVFVAFLCCFFVLILPLTPGWQVGLMCPFCLYAIRAVFAIGRTQKEVRALYQIYDNPGSDEAAAWYLKQQAENKKVAPNDLYA